MKDVGANSYYKVTTVCTPVVGYPHNIGHKPIYCCTGLYYSINVYQNNRHLYKPICSGTGLYPPWLSWTFFFLSTLDGLKFFS